MPVVRAVALDDTINRHAKRARASGQPRIRPEMSKLRDMLREALAFERAPESGRVAILAAGPKKTPGDEAGRLKPLGARLNKRFLAGGRIRLLKQVRNASAF